MIGSARGLDQNEQVCRMKVVEPLLSGMPSVVPVPRFRCSSEVTCTGRSGTFAVSA